ncbi:MAG: hypothetical protein PHQ33_08300 [Bacteroidales bacterium]|nr:hypothetical protein [Bacteroidales bacterium]
MKKTILILFAALFWCGALQAQYTVYTVHIGDVLCTDNTTVAPNDFAGSGKTAQGVVFFVDSTGEHGWAVALTESSTTYRWENQTSYTDCHDISSLPNLTTRDEALSDYNGYSNTQKIRAAGGSSLYPAVYAVDFAAGWFLPAAGQLRILYAMRNEVQNTLTILTNAGVTTGVFNGYYYWSSSEYSQGNAWYVGCHGYNGSNGYKSTDLYVRSVRAF